MSPAVNPRRRYDSTRRQEQARQTRWAILQAARAAFLEHGYAATTIAAIATHAGVSVETIYKTFGNKPGLVKAVFDVAVVGDDEPVPMMEREFVRRSMAEPDPRVKIRDFGQHLAENAQRAGPVQLLVRDAAVGDPAAAEVWQQMQNERLIGMSSFASNLKEGGHLRKGVSADTARDVLWTISAVELYELLVLQRGWSPKRYGRFVAESAITALL